MIVEGVTLRRLCCRTANAKERKKEHNPERNTESEQETSGTAVALQPFYERDYTLGIEGDGPFARQH
jgi:hypothetical protein